MQYTNFLELAKRRHSCRAYLKDKLVDKTVIEQILEAARLAPSACNKQPWKFLVVTSKERCSMVCDCYPREWAKSAPAFIIAIGLHNEAWHRADDNKDHTDIDLAIAIEHICLEAADLGLGTCWICNFDVEKLRDSLNLTPEMEPIAIIPLGYPANDTFPEKVRKNINDIIIWD